ncbi:MAG: Asp-tRNA(Asn)/Glu-tRNA(Gln) amidotransferase subunit GatC [Candidatus Spechtbacterales bacterium]
MKLTKKEIQHIADLARLKVSDEELKNYSEDMSEILGYVEQLNKIDTEGVEPKVQAAATHGVFRKDEQRSGPRKAEVLLRLVSFKEKGFVKVKAVFKK